MDDLQRREFHEALLDAAAFEDLPGKWQAAILTAEENRPKLGCGGRLAAGTFFGLPHRDVPHHFGLAVRRGGSTLAGPRLRDDRA
jgi:hypothetical protein